MLQPVIMNVSSKGAVVIPVKIRRALGIMPKGKVILIPKTNEAKAEILAAEEDPIEYLCGVLKGKRSGVKELLEERKKDLEIDEREYARHGS